MPLTIENKKAIVADVAAVARQAVSAAAAEYRGLSVTAMTELRFKARAQGLKVRVVRNTLARRAFGDTSFACMQDSLVGPLVLVFSQDEPSAPARLLREFSKSNEALRIHALALDGQLFPGSSAEAIAKLPTKKEALSQLMAMLQAPTTKMVRTIAEPTAKMARTMAAVRDQKSAA